jgi:hypothetical protein
VRRLASQDLWHDETLVHWLQTQTERPHHKRLFFKIPNPATFIRTLGVRHWLSGEFAAAAEGFDLVPERLMIYVEPGSMQEASTAALDQFAKVAPPAAANLIIVLVDPWMYLDRDASLIERGQRLLDYAESRHLQILKELKRERAL